MCHVKGGLAKNLEDFIPNICTESPAPGKAQRKFKLSTIKKY